MKLKMFSVWDDKAKAFLPPFFLAEQGMALRAFADCCSDPGHAFGRHPADYTLFHFGVFDVRSGQFDLTAAETLANGVQMVKREVAPAQLALVENKEAVHA